MTPERVLGFAASAVIVAAIVGGLVLVEGPGSARAERFDTERVQNLGSLIGLIESHFATEDTLPAALTVFTDESDYARVSTDPRTGEPYPYSVVGDDMVRLCATFETNGPHQVHPLTRGVWPGAPRSVTPRSVDGAGPHCFEVRFGQKD